MADPLYRTMAARADIVQRIEGASAAIAAHTLGLQQQIAVLKQVETEARAFAASADPDGALGGRPQWGSRLRTRPIAGR